LQRFYASPFLHTLPILLQMAVCHYCGAAGADTRREVQTGRSKYYGRRSTSTRYSYGMRPVCGPCATQVDREYWRQELSNNRLSVVILVLLAIGLSAYIFVR
jgi:hypothetical protein